MPWGRCERPWGIRLAAGAKNYWALIQGESAESRHALDGQISDRSSLKLIDIQGLYDS